MIHQTHQEWRSIYQLQQNKYKGNGKPAQEKSVVSLSMIIQHAIIPTESIFPQPLLNLTVGKMQESRKKL